MRLRLHLLWVLAAVALMGCVREDSPQPSNARPDTVAYAQIDTAGVQVPPELGAFCRPGTASLRPGTAPPAVEGGRGESVPAVIIFKHPQTHIRQPVRCVVRQAQDWATLWSAARRGVTPAPPVPPVDFGASMLLVAGMGPQPSTGYGIAITEVRRTESAIVATVERYVPGVCPRGAGFTEPMHAIAIPRYNAPVRFVEKVRYGADCSA